MTPQLLIFFPFLTILLGSICLLCGITLTPYPLIFSFALTAFLAYKFSGKNGVCKFCGLILLALFLSLLSFGPIESDSTYAHGSAILLLSEGWNPIYQPQIPDVAPFYLNATQITFLPKASWYFGTMFYQLTGWLETANVWLFLALFAAFSVLKKFIAEFFELTGWRNLLMTLCLLFPPWCVDFMSLRIDTQLYCLLLILICSTLRFVKYVQFRDLILAGTAMPLLIGLKFFCIVPVLAISFYMLLILFIRKDFTWQRSCFLVLCVAMTSSVIIGFSPYITQFKVLVNSKDRQEIVQKSTDDFFRSNDDFKAMNYLGRFAYAYFSESLTCRFYSWKTGTKDFSPYVEVPDGVKGFGIMFRLLLLTAIITLIENWRHCKILPMIALIFIVSLLTPTIYVGFTRYTPLLYALPLLIILDCRMKNKFLLIPIALVCLTINVKNIGIAGWRIIQSIQNIEVATYALKNENSAKLVSSLYASHRYFDKFIPEISQFGTPVPHDDFYFSGGFFYALKMTPGTEPPFPELRSYEKNMRMQSEKTKSANVINFAGRNLCVWFTSNGWKVPWHWLKLRKLQFKKRNESRSEIQTK